LVSGSNGTENPLKDSGELHCQAAFKLGMTLLCFNRFPGFNCTVIALNSRTVALGKASQKVTDI
jgi:hypothetical protein